MKIFGWEIKLKKEYVAYFKDPDFNCWFYDQPVKNKKDLRKTSIDGSSRQQMKVKTRITIEF